jgi:asparagine synthase (glutamine-hydrolysing)
MCGIVGLALNKTTNVSHEIFEGMIKSMSHRGPDSSGIFIENNIYLGHRRLSIIDLSSNANHPLWTEDKKVGIIFNGEIYNYKELRNQLSQIGVKFLTQSDTEVILQAYCKWGIKSFQKLNGIFAFSIYDKRQSDHNPVKYIVRDRFGVKPLFYSYKNKNLCYSSEMKPHLQLPWISKEIDSTALYYFLKFSHVPNPLCMIKDIHQLEAGHYLEWTNEDLKIKQFSEHSSLPKIKNEDEALHKLEIIFSQTMKRQVISDVPVGIFLSGGIDSTLILAKHIENSKQTINTFTIGYHEEHLSEASHAKKIANHFNTNHHEFILKPSDLISMVQDLPKFFDQPFADPTSLPTMYLCKEAKNFVTVALAGDGGDEIFFGYTYQQILLYLKWWKEVPFTIREKISHLGQFLLKLGIRCESNKLAQLYKMLEINKFKNDYELFQYFIGTIGPVSLDRIDLLVNQKINREKPYFQKFEAELDSRSWFEKIEFIFQKTFLIDTVLQKSDRSSMAYGLELRVPFLDNELVDFSNSLDRKLKYKFFNKKHILKKYLETKVPKNLFDRPKQGFSIPMKEWLRSEFKPLMNELLSEDALRDNPYLNSLEVNKLVHEHTSNQFNHSHLIWSLMNFELWRKYYL